MDAEQIRFIREEIKRQLNIVLNAEVGETTTSTETINALFPGMPAITDRPVMHPWGFVSRAVQSTISVVAKVGADIHNRMVIGHRDVNRPTDLDEGECAIYSMGEYQVRVLNDRIQFGKNGVYESAVMGTTLSTLLGMMLTQIAQHQHICSVPGSLGFVPNNQQDFLDDKENFIDNKDILSEDDGRFE